MTEDQAGVAGARAGRALWRFAFEVQDVARRVRDISDDWRAGWRAGWLAATTDPVREAEAALGRPR